MEEQKLNIFDYDDYRKFLHDYYRVQKKRNPSISYRYIARRVGFKSPGHFTQIIQGKINISIKLIDKFSEFIGFSEHETSFFRSLVLFNQAPTEEEKSGYYQKMAALKDITIVKTSETQNEYYSEIYYAAIRELLIHYPFKNEYADLARQLIPPITKEQAKEAISLLRRLGLIEKDEQGYYRPTHLHITATLSDTKSALEKIHKKNLAHAREALDHIISENRSFSFVTFSIPPDKMVEIKAEISKCRRNIMKIAESASGSSQQVFQCSIELFPLSHEISVSAREGNQRLDK